MGLGYLTPFPASVFQLFPGESYVRIETESYATYR